MSNITESQNDEPTNTNIIPTSMGGFKKQKPLHDSKTSIKNPDVLDLLEDGKYIDKTKKLMFFLTSEDRMVCLRPRRIGKTTTINTISAIFEGHKYREWFKDTAIYNDHLENEKGEYIDNNGKLIEANSENEKVPVKYNWEAQPVFEFSFMGVVSTDDENETETNIITLIVLNAEKYGLVDELEKKVKGESIYSYLITLFSLLSKKFNKKKITVLIDEYDYAFHEYLYDNVGQFQKQKY
eukprot:GAHX01002005.1.p1 GENE.GAHX01002005.1~~GAHX01002005.1.p1  ORF type:complete len:258 (+),score=52.61 GAHX01002005.1:59-775(+)